MLIIVKLWRDALEARFNEIESVASETAELIIHVQASLDEQFCFDRDCVNVFY